jgi:hypothetical protein
LGKAPRADRRGEYSSSFVKPSGGKGAGACAARVAHLVEGIGRTRRRLRPPLRAFLCCVSKTTFGPGIYSM